MSKFWIAGGAVVAASVAVMVWNPGPVRSSENLLGKAQSEFAMKARDALIQRNMAQASTASRSTTRPTSDSSPPYAVASLEPVAASTRVAHDTRFEADSSNAQVTTPDSVLRPVPPAVPLADKAQATKPQMASLPEEPQGRPTQTELRKPGVRRSERTASRTLTPSDLEALRTRSPEFAAAMARYM